MKHKEATRLVGGKVQWTNATDEDGIPVALSAFDHERLSREDERGLPETGSEEPEGVRPRLDTPELQTEGEPRPWWRRVFGG